MLIRLASWLSSWKLSSLIDIADQFGHACYAPLVEFRMLTGCRPEEVFALEWSDIKHGKNGRVDIVFNKAYTYGELKNETKTGVTRIFPCNSQLLTLLDSIPKNHPKLIFPSLEGKYISEKNFNSRQWKAVIEGLIEDGELNRHLPFYNVRHSFITNLVRQGYDIATVSTWVGNSPETIMANYLAVNHEIVPPIL